MKPSVFKENDRWIIHCEEHGLTARWWQWIDAMGHAALHWSMRHGE